MIKKQIEKELRARCNGYKIIYNKHKEKIWKMLNQKVKDTKEPITDVDTKEVCKLITENCRYRNN